MYIERNPTFQMNQEGTKQSLFESVWPKSSYHKDIFNLFLSSYNTFFCFTISLLFHNY